MSRVPGSRPQESHSPALSKGLPLGLCSVPPCFPLVPGLVLSLPKELAPGKAPSYLVHTSGNTILLESSSASPDSSWGLGLLRVPPGSLEPTARREVAGP